MSIRLSKQKAYDLMTTAVEGGIGYWLHDEEDCRNIEITRNGQLNVTEITFEADVDGKGWKQITINPQAIRTAVDKVVDRKVTIREDLIKMVKTLSTDDYDVDAEGADCLVQIAAFGEIVYG